MNIDELLGHSADDIERMTDEQLNTILMPYFNVTRPEQAPRPTNNGKMSAPINPALRSGVAEAQSKLGIDLSYLFNKGKKR